MTDGPFADLIGAEVEVETQIGDMRWTDRGVLEFADSYWVRIRKSGGDVMCFPVRNVRYVKAWS